MDIQDLVRLINNSPADGIIDCSRKDLSGICLSGWNLEKFIFTEANLSNSNLPFCRMGLSTCHANFTGSNLRNTNWGTTIAQGANFSRANLTQANFEKADLNQAIFRGAVMTNAKLNGAEIAGCKNLAKIGPIGSRDDFLYGVSDWENDRLVIMFKTGCFFGSQRAFEKNILIKHGRFSPVAMEYFSAISLIKRLLNNRSRNPRQ